MTSEAVPPGVLSVRLLRGINLVKRDADGSDPYVVVHLENQNLKTSVIKNTVNPVWNEELTLAVTNPATPIKIVSWILTDRCFRHPPAI
jgi:Ca2+-dependent lipid-binding protein